MSFAHLLSINRNIRILTMGQDVTKSVGRVLTHRFSFIFSSQEELIASKVILLPCTKLIVKVSYLVAIFKKIT